MTPSQPGILARQLRRDVCPPFHRELFRLGPNDGLRRVVGSGWLDRNVLRGPDGGLKEERSCLKSARSDAEIWLRGPVGIEMQGHLARPGSPGCDRIWMEGHRYGARPWTFWPGTKSETFSAREIGLRNLAQSDL